MMARSRCGWTVVPASDREDNGWSIRHTVTAQGLVVTRVFLGLFL